jgi:hypothetical protein
MEQLFLFKKCKLKTCQSLTYWTDNQCHCPEHHYKLFTPPEIKERTRRIKSNLRKRIRDLIKDQGDYSSRIGCTGRELKEHLESKFYDKISWDNYGTIWHVDHIKPISCFNLLDPKERMQANHYTNLQPLLAKDNIKKSNKYDPI